MNHELLKYSDGGLQMTAYKGVEKNDCTVRALAILAKVPYEKAHEILELGGRRNRKGFYMGRFLERNPVLCGYKFTPVSFGERLTMGKTLRQFINNNKKGEYMVFVRGHATSVVDGKCVDTYIRPKSRVINVFRVEPTDLQMENIKPNWF